MRCWSGCFAGGAAAHRRRLQTIMLLLQAVEKKGFCSSLLLRSPPLLLLRFLSPLVCFVSLLFFFLSLSSKPHSPSPVCVFPSSFLFGPFSSLSVWVCWWFLSVPVLLSSIHFPFSFSFSVRSFLSFPLLFLCLSLSSFFSPLSSPACWRCGGVLIGQKERGLFIAMHGDQGSAGLAGQ